MKIKIKDVDINYIQYGNEKGQDIVLLHGWGQNIEMMKPIGDAFSKNFRITILDLPGFGDSSEPTYDWTIDDYALMLSSFIKELKIKKPIIMGHSFGGRLAMAYSYNNPISKLVIFAGPCTVENENPSLKTRVLKKLYSIDALKKIGDVAKNYIGSRDYKAASPMMKKILVNTVSKDLTGYARQIEEPTLLIWGDNDTEAKLSDGRLLEEIMGDAALIVLPGTHYAYLENLGQVIKILSNFLES